MTWMCFVLMSLPSSFVLLKQNKRLEIRMASTHQYADLKHDKENRRRPFVLVPPFSSATSLHEWYRFYYPRVDKVERMKWIHWIQSAKTSESLRVNDVGLLLSWIVRAAPLTRFICSYQKIQNQQTWLVRTTNCGNCAQSVMRCDATWVVDSYCKIVGSTEIGADTEKKVYKKMKRCLNIHDSGRLAREWWHQMLIMDYADLLFFAIIIIIIIVLANVDTWFTPLSLLFRWVREFIGSFDQCGSLRIFFLVFRYRHRIHRWWWWNIWGIWAWISLMIEVFTMCTSILVRIGGEVVWKERIPSNTGLSFCILLFIISQLVGWLTREHNYRVCSTLDNDGLVAGWRHITQHNGGFGSPVVRSN